MEGYRIRDGKAGEGGDLVDDAVGIVRGRADEEDRVWIYEAADFGNGNAIKIEIVIAREFFQNLLISASG